MYSESVLKVKFTLTKAEKDVLNAACEILSHMEDEASYYGSTYFNETYNVLDEITSNIESTDDSNTYVYVFEE